MKLYVWTEVFIRRQDNIPTGPRTCEEVSISVVADSLELAIATVEASYLNEYDAECPWDLTHPEKIIDPAYKEAYIFVF